jgi:nitrogen-specific signal transduction histidine kinase
MEAVGRLAGGVAHDFNNLLTVITGYSDLMLASRDLNDPQRAALEEIRRSAERGGQLTHQLLAFSRRQPLEPHIVRVNELILQMENMLRRLIGEDLELITIPAASRDAVEADAGRLEQVIMNLVVNARDAMPKGGTLTIETANVELDENYSGRHLAVKPGPYVQIAVSDNGGGMDEATQARLFEPFFTTKAVGRGTGLGLSTVFGIVKQSGGNLDVYSVPDRGTSVKVYLPRIDQPAVVETVAARKRVASGSETVLLVEDEEMVRRLVREALVRAGYKVMDTSDPLEARRLSESYRGTIHLLITDVVMPKVSGRELAEELRARRGGMKVLYMSGYTDHAIVNTGILQKEVAFLQKPFTPAALTQKVREVLESGGITCGAGE